MNKYKSNFAMLGLGLGADPYADQPWLGTQTTTAPAVEQNFWNKAGNTLEDILGLTQQAAQVYQTVKAPATTTAPKTTTAAPATTTAYQTPTVKKGLSTGAKIGIGVAAVAAVAGIAYLATRKKKAAKK